MKDFKTLFTDIQQEVETLAQSMAGEYKDAAIADGRSLLQEMRADLERWLTLLASGDLKPQEFEWLVNSNKSLVKMTGLKQAGLAAVQVKNFSKSLLKTIITTSIQAVAQGGN